MWRTDEGPSSQPSRAFDFDANGDITESPVTILRVATGGGSNRILSTEGGVVEQVVRPSPRLVTRK
jgi:hypothetical protein